MLKLHGHELSGNSYKPRLLLHLLDVPYTWVRVDLMQGEHRSPAYRALNPFGQVPLLEDDTDGTTVRLADAQAILVYLARRHGGEAWLPLEPLPLAQVIRWLSITAGEVRQGPEQARLHQLFGVSSINLERAQERAAFILGQLDQHLASRTWLEFERPTIADVAVFPYVALAPDGGIDLSSYPQVLAWIERLRQLPGYVPMEGDSTP
ncbi:glutathione S-transferase family protein [Synechococcus sp. GFB01]|uniref:glutathione S-transferase family protein n=1 Tax=Synechococcus sp. GFB01 TaxID=1662190 RepID=UPI00064EFFC7|nr:glutathione S-transferase [Synechococcus sp. GFB01]KMM16292.1 glutathione S-transferase [Synechococcus sp. GFB01]